MAERVAKNLRRDAVAVAGLAALSVLVFGSAARYPLLADDYHYLQVAQTPGWWHAGLIWNLGGQPINHLFRPVLFLWFGLVHAVFGLHPLPIHITTGFVVLAAGVLTGLIARRLGLTAGAYAAAAIYGLHASMATPIAWTSAVNSPIATTLALAALYCMLRRRLRAVDVGAACALFLVGLMTREVVAVTPVVLVGARYLIETAQPWRSRLRRSLAVSSPLWFIAIGYATARRLAGFHSTSGPYQQRLTSHAFRNFGQLMEYASEFGYSRHMGVLVTVFWTVLLGLCGFVAWRCRRYQALLGAGWALLGVLPVIFLAVHHMEYYYVDFALPGVALAIGAVFECAFDATPGRSRAPLAVACLAALVAVNSYTAGREVHAYLGASAAQTRRVIAQVRRAHPHPAPGSTIVLPISSTAAGFEDFPDVIRVIYDDPTLQVAYSG